MIERNIVLMADAPPGGGGGGNTSWRDTLPEDIRANPSLATIADVPALAKSYVNAQQLIGAKRFAIPADGSGPDAWNEVYAALGRPEAPDKYSKPTVTPAQGVTVSQEETTKAYQLFHKAGLSDAQAKQVMDYYMTGINEGHQRLTSSAATARASAEESLRQEWGDKYDANLQVARGTLRKFGTPEAMAEIEAGLGNNPAMVKMLHKMGIAMMDDKTIRGGGIIDSTSMAAAQQQIDQLKSDAQFQAVLNDRSKPGHKEAVERWTNLHRQAIPQQ